jgi:hypothetical protein
MGLIATIELQAAVGKLSGILLISAGVVIWHLRLIYRRHHRRPRKRDLSWGANQRMHPPKETKSGTMTAEQAPPAPKREEDEDF